MNLSKLFAIFCGMFVVITENSIYYGRNPDVLIGISITLGLLAIIEAIQNR